MSDDSRIHAFQGYPQILPDRERGGVDSKAGTLRTPKGNTRQAIPRHSSPTALKIKQVLYKKLSEIFKPSSAKISDYFADKTKLYAVKRLHQKFDASRILARTKYGDDVAIGVARNVAQVPVVRNQEDFGAAKFLLHKVADLAKKPELRFAVIDRDATPQSAAVDGLCAGISMDIACRAAAGATIEQIIQENEAGAPAEAAANQAVYWLLCAQTGFVNALAPLCQLACIKGVEHSPFKANFQDVSTALCLLDPSYAALQKEIGAFPEVDPSQTSSDTTLISLLRKMITSEHDVWEVDKETGKNMFVVNKFIDIITKIMCDFYDKEINENPGMTSKFQGAKEQDLESLKWLASFLEMSVAPRPVATKPKTEEEGVGFLSKLKQMAIKLFGKEKSPQPQKVRTTDKISDPERRFLINGLRERSIQKIKLGAVAAARGLEYVPVPGFENEVTLPSDRAFLKQLRDIPAGTYALTIVTAKFGHAITYIKNNDGSCYILDPNTAQLKALNHDQAIELFEKLLGKYDQPKERGPYADGDMPCHQLRIMQYKKAL